MITEGYHTEAQALIELEQWCEVEGHKTYSATKLFREKCQQIKAESTQRNSSDNTLKVSHVNPFGSSVNNDSSSKHNLADNCLITLGEWKAFQESIQSPGSFNPFDCLPKQLGEKAVRDAARLSVDPLAIWAYLLPSVASLMGSTTVLDMGGGWRTPNILWSLLVAESGTGKTRAKNLVTATLDRWNELEYQQFKEKLARWKKDQEGPRPQLRKFLFSIATPQGIVKRLSEQGNGVLWCRDEIKGVFGGLNQFTREGEGLEILLESWDGSPSVVDRVDEENSYLVPESRLSLAGGIQPKVLARTFDMEDAQGVLARFMVVAPQEFPYHRVKGAAELADELPLLYGFIKSVEWGCIRPDVEADELFTVIAEDFNNQKAPVQSAQPWIRKLAGQTARMAMVLHAIDCYYDRSKDTGVLTRDTLQMAYELAQHYQRHFYHLMGVSANEGLSGILATIQNRANSSPEGVTARDLARGKGARAIEKQAKAEGMKGPEFAMKLLEELRDNGYGTLEEVKAVNGRTTIRYIAIQNSVDTVDTTAETPTKKGIEPVATGVDAVDTTPPEDAISPEDKGIEPVDTIP